MALIDKLRNLYYDYRIRENPEFLLKMKNPDITHISLSFSLNPELFNRLVNPSYKAVEFIFLKYPEQLKKNHAISEGVKEKLVTAYPQSIRYLNDVPDRLYIQAGITNPRILRNIQLPSAVQDSLYQRNSGLLLYIHKPHSDLQVRAFKENWKNFYLLKEPSPAVYSEVLRFLGISSQNITPTICKGVNNLFNTWKSIEEQYDFSMPFSQDQIEFLERGESGTSYEERQDEYIDKYRQSVVDFHTATGLRIDSSSAMKISNKESYHPFNLIPGIMMIQGIIAGSMEVAKLPYSDPSLSIENLCNIQNTDNNEFQQILKHEGLSIQDLDEKFIDDFSKKGMAELPNGHTLQRIKGPAGFSLRVSRVMEPSSSVEQCEM